MSQYRSLRDILARLRRGADQFSTGGSWAGELPETNRSNLRWFFFDGLFASASDAISLTYLTLYVLALGATSAQIGFMAALASLSAAVLLMPGAMLSERSGKRKLIVVGSAGGVTRVTLLLMALTPLIIKGPVVVYAAIALKIIGDAFGSLAVPAWTSLSAGIVPMRWRGRYFGSRNLVMGLSNMVTVLLVGQMITGMDSVGGYQIALGLAFVIGIIATYSFYRIQEPAPVAPRPERKGYTPASLLHTLRSDRNFMAFCTQAMVWNFSLNIAGPFFNVHMVENLHATAAMVGLTTIVSSLTGLPAMRLFGQLADRFGPRKIQLLTGLAIPLLPLAWVFARSPWTIVLINFVSGFVWAGYNLGSFNFLLLLTPEDQRERYTALYQIVVTLFSAVGAAVGGIIAGYYGYLAVFLVSGIGRFVAMFVFARFVRQPAADDEPLPEPAAAGAD